MIALIKKILRRKPTHAVLTRTYLGDDCTLGVLTYKHLKVFTLEEPWKNNLRTISCIPAGVYECVHHNGRKFKDVWKLTNVENRTAILIHSGNTTDDIEG